MKKLILISAISIAISSCSDFLEISPKGSLSESVLATKDGVESLLIGAYAALDGSGNNIGQWESSSTNWIYGSIAGGDAHKGSYVIDGFEITEIELYRPNVDNPYLNTKWRAIYEGVSRANAVLRVIKNVDDATEQDTIRIRAEARVLRGIFHFEAIKMWKMVPYIYENDNPSLVKNIDDIWPQIEDDIRSGYEKLPETMDAVGRINKWVAGALLGKLLLFQHKYDEAKMVLEDVFKNGKNPLGIKFNLTPRFHENFNIDNEQNSEVVLAFQFSVKDGADGDTNGNFGEVLNYPMGAPPGYCCGFFQPSSELVNSYRTNSEGHPLLDGSYNDDDNAVKDDEKFESSDNSFVPDTGNLDPRVDWTVGRRGIPFLDYGDHPGRAWWFRPPDGNGGPYNAKKNVIYQSQFSTYGSSGWAPNVTAKNFVVMRFADIILWLAECEVEVGSFDRAREYVNMIRKRAANSEGFVMRENGVTPAANYVIDIYAASGYPFDTKENALKAVHFERKLELAMEGHRLFDLVRWNEASTALATYLDYEKTKRTYMMEAKFDAGIDEYFPIPQRQIDLMGADILFQNR